MSQSKKKMLKGIYRQALEVGIRLSRTKPSQEVFVTFARLHGDIVQAAIGLSRRSGASLSEVGQCVSSKTVADLRERLLCLKASR